MKTIPIYVDFDSTFEPHPVTGDLPLLIDEVAVKRSIRNLILTNFYERPFQSRKGSQVKGALFENYNPVTVQILKQNIEQCLNNFEPRARIINVKIYQKDPNSVNVTIIFALLNNDSEVELTITLDRIN